MRSRAARRTPAQTQADRKRKRDKDHATEQTRTLLRAAFAERRHLTALLENIASAARDTGAEFGLAGGWLSAVHVRKQLNAVMAAAHKIQAQMRRTEQAICKLLAHYKRVAEDNDNANDSGGGAGGSGDAAAPPGSPVDDADGPEAVARALEHPSFGELFAACVQYQGDQLGVVLPPAAVPREREAFCAHLRTSGAPGALYATAVGAPWLLDRGFKLVEEFKADRRIPRATHSTASNEDDDSTHSGAADSSSSADDDE